MRRKEMTGFFLKEVLLLCTVKYFKMIRFAVEGFNIDNTQIS